MRLVVVDAAAFVELLLRTSRGRRIEQVVAGPENELHAPALCDVEVASVLRRLSLEGTLSDERRAEALLDYRHLPVTRHGHLALLARVLELRENFSAYDATYVALAERLGAGLLSADARLGRGVEARTAVAVEIVQAGDP